MESTRHIDERDEAIERTTSSHDETPAPLLSLEAPLKMAALRDCYETLDTEMITVTLALFAFAVLVLSPRGSFRGFSLTGFSLTRRQNTGDSQFFSSSPRNSRVALCQDGEEEGALSSTRTTTTNSTNDMEDETEEEAFEKLWPTIRSAGYRHLVLPPECKLVVDIPAFRKKLQKNEANASKHLDVEEDDDHPLTRLKSYAEHLLELLRNFLSYDYVSAGWMIIDWINYWLRLKSRKPHEVVEEDEDDSVSSVHRRVGKRSKSIDNSQIRSEGGKHDMVRRTSSSSEFESVAGDENDVGLPPLSPSGGLWRGSVKRKDALDSYRSKVPLHVANPATPPATPATSPTDADSHESSRAEFRSPLEKQPKSQRQSKDMSFFDAAHSRASLRKLHVEVPVPDRNGYILGDDFLANTRQTPLLVFVNSRSGGQQGQLLIGQLRRLLNPIQVWDLAVGSPDRILESFCALTRLRIMVCGGDGTVSWIISCLEKMKNLERWPPIAILPLGTGNDLARIHGWGGGYNNESLISILEQVAESYISLLDRWEMKIENRKGKVKSVKSFFNYVGVGADAQAALQVHMLRESKPQLFFSRVFNKMWYLLFGAEEAIKESNVNLPNEITVIADGVEVPLPPDSQGIILLNIDSYAGGVPIWSHGVKDALHHFNRWGPPSIEEELAPRRVQSAGHLSSPDFIIDRAGFDRVDSVDDFQVESEEDTFRQLFSCDRPSSCQDGSLEIVSVRGTYHIGQIRVGLSNATRICQAKEVKIICKKKIAAQVDGEPWRQSACTMTISRKKEPAMMLHRSADESGGVETEMAKLLDWAEDRRIIDHDVHAVLMKEFSRRIENKTRQRRVRSQDNLMLSLKRAIASGGNLSQPGFHSGFPGTLSF